MTRSIDETRREFLRRVAATVAFVPPAMASVAATGLAAQGKAGSTTTVDDATTTVTDATNDTGGKGKGNSSTNTTTIGSLSPTAQSVSTPTFSAQQSTAETPWQPGGLSKPPPWAAPPPTQTGR